MESFFFYLFSFILVASALAVVFARNPLYNVLSLVVTIFALSSLFILLKAFFVAIILLLVYAGAVIVFFLFVVMCLKLNAPGSVAGEQRHFHRLGIIAGTALLVEIAFSIHGLKTLPHAPVSIKGTIEAVGQILFTDYLLPFELTSFLLLITVFGVVALAKGAWAKPARPA